MRTVAPWLALALGLLATPTARAEPYFAQREGYRCSKCHVNRTGGGMRTAFGRQWAWTHLVRSAPPTPNVDIEEELSNLQRRAWWTIDPALTDDIAVGADIRVGNITALAEEVQNTFTNPEASLYLALDATHFATAYFDLSLAEGSAQAREAFLLLHGAGLYLKAGIILLPYGLRIWGDEQFIRSETGFNFASPDLGIEVGYENGPFGLFVAASNGAGGGLDSDRDKQLSGLMEWAGPWWRVGASGSFNRTARTEDLFFGGFAGLTLGRLTLLAEVDRLRTRFVEEDESIVSLVAFGEADFLVAQGLNLKVAYGFHDPDLDIEENQRFTLLCGLEIFAAPMFATRVFYEFRGSVPQDEVGNADRILVELHVYL